MPPFQAINLVGFHYVKAVNNLPQDPKIETLEVLDERFLRRKNGEFIYFATSFGGNFNYWRVIGPDTPVTIEKGSANLVTVTIYDKKAEYEFRDAQKSMYGQNAFVIPLFAFEIPSYRVLKLTGGDLPVDLKATGEMLFGAANYATDSDWVQYLLDRGAELNYQDPASLKTSLHQAISRRKFSIARQLIGAGAKYDITDNNGVTAVDQVMNIYQHPRGLVDTE